MQFHGNGSFEEVIDLQEPTVAETMCGSGIHTSVPRTQVTTKESAVVDQSNHTGWRLIDVKLSDATGMLGISVAILALATICLCLNRCCHKTIPALRASYKRRKMKSVLNPDKIVLDRTNTIDLSRYGRAYREYDPEEVIDQLDKIMARGPKNPPGQPEGPRAHWPDNWRQEMIYKPKPKPRKPQEVPEDPDPPPTVP